MEKQVLSVKINTNLYHQLKSEVGRGRISLFVEKLIEKELSEQDEKLAWEYQAAAKDKKRREEAKEWELAQMTDWYKQDDGKND